MAIHVTHENSAVTGVSDTPPVVGFSRQDGITAPFTFYPSDWVDTDQVYGDIELTGLVGWYAIHETEDGSYYADPSPITEITKS